MSRFTVVQVVKDHYLYEWVEDRLKQEGITLQMGLCHAATDLEQHAEHADLIWSYGGGGPDGLFSGANLAKLRHCGALLRTGSGVDDIDLAAATRLGIIVANTPHAVADAVAEHTIALVFAVVRQTTRQDRLVRRGQWLRRDANPGRLLKGATLGLVGFGHVARLIIDRLSGFHMTVLVYDPYVGAEEIEKCGARATPLDELLQRADIVSLHCPLNDMTRALVGERELHLMRREAYLINTARGPVVDESALVRALREDWIAGAALDVLEQEPPTADNVLFQLDNVVITPHMAGYEASYPLPFVEASIESIVDLSKHRWPYSVVNPQVTPRWTDMQPRAR